MNFIYTLSSYLWNIFLPIMVTMGIFIIKKTYDIKKSVKKEGKETWSLKKIKNSLTISLSSKVGTGAIIGVLAAMNRLSGRGSGGEGIVLWVLVGIFILVPVTYSEVFLSRFTNRLPRDFIDEAFNKKIGTTYILSLITLYSFGFVGFQLSGIQSVVKIFTDSVFDYNLNPGGVLLFVLLPILLGIFIILITKSHQLFIDVLSSMISTIIFVYVIFFVVFLVKTHSFIPRYLDLVVGDFLSFKSVATGVPLGLIIGFQRIIQISETALGTSALSSSDGENTPEREALLQTIATVLTLFIAVIITSYIFTYGREMIEGVELSESGFLRILGYITTVKVVTGLGGVIVVIAFFIISGFTTILGSFHFLNTSLHMSEGKRIAIFMSLITTSALLSISNFDTIFDIVDLLMFLVGGIMLVAMVSVVKKIK